MKKIINIEDNLNYHKLIKDICGDLGSACFPETEDMFKELRSCFVPILTIGEYEQPFQDERIQKVRQMIADYIGDTEDKDVLCICDYHLFDRKKPTVNGINFYRKFLGGDKNVICISGTFDPNEIRQITAFCAEKENRLFLQKVESGFEETLIEKIEDFLKEE